MIFIGRWETKPLTDDHIWRVADHPLVSREVLLKLVSVVPVFPAMV